VVICHLASLHTYSLASLWVLHSIFTVCNNFSWFNVHFTKSLKNVIYIDSGQGHPCHSFPATPSFFPSPLPFSLIRLWTLRNILYISKKKHLFIHLFNGDYLVGDSTFLEKMSLIRVTVCRTPEKRERLSPPQKAKHYSGSKSSNLAKMR